MLHSQLMVEKNAGKTVKFHGTICLNEICLINMHYIFFWKKDRLCNDCLFVYFTWLFWFAESICHFSWRQWMSRIRKGVMIFKAYFNKIGWSCPSIYWCDFMYLTYHSHTGKVSLTKCSILNYSLGHLLKCKSTEKHCESLTSSNALKTFSSSQP